MRLLDRYLLRELMTPLAFCLGGFLIFWISFDLFDKLNTLQEHKLHGGEVVAYELLRTPELLTVVAPVALLLASLYALTQHARYHELTAIRAAGVSLWRLAAPYLALGLLASAGLFLMNELVAPRGTELAEQILNRYTAGWAKTVNPFEKVFFITRNGQKWAVDFNEQTRQLRDVNIDWQKKDGSRLVFFAKVGTYRENTWTFIDVQEKFFEPGSMFPANQVKTNALAMPEFVESPEQISSDLDISRQSTKAHVEQTQIPLSRLLNFLRQHPELPRRDRQWRWVNTQLHGRLAAPWTCLVVVLVAIPFGAAGGRRNVFVGVAGSIFICFVYFVLLQVGLALGTGGQLPPWMGAWLPNIFFSSVAVGLTFKVR